MSTMEVEPDRISNYKILQLIGEGSFGKVFKAAEIGTNNVVALKILQKRGRSKELDAFKQEASIQQGLRHPNIIQLLNTFETEKELVFVSELAISDLHKLLAKVGSLGEKRTQQLSYDLISALYYLHSHRILHRDMKPSNILLDKNYKAKVCDFGLARNMTLGTQILTSIKGTPLYMAPELLEGRGYGHEADLWSLGCIIFECLAGESPFSTRSILHLMKLIRYHCIKWPSFLSATCISFLKGLLINSPQKRMSWDEILDHKFVKGNILILSGDQISDSPFTRPRTAIDPQTERTQHAASIMRITQLKKMDAAAVGDGDLMSSRDSIKVNANMPSDMDETDNEDLLSKLDHQNELETSDGALDKLPEIVKEDRSLPALKAQLEQFQRHNIHQFQLDGPRMHNISNFQPLPENQNMVMHRFMDNIDPELQNFMTSPQMMMIPGQFPVMPKTVNCGQKVIQDLENLSLRIDKSVEGPTAQSSLKKSQKTQSDGVSTDVSSVPVETEEWLQFLFKSMQEILDGELELYKQANMMTMIVGLLRNPKFNGKLVDHVVQIICLPYAIDMPYVDEFSNMLLQMKIVPNLVYASKLLCNRKLQQNSMETVPKSEEIIEFNDQELKTLSGIYDLVTFLVHSGETFLHMLCDAMAILSMDHLFRSFLHSGITGDSSDAVRLTSSVIALICAILQDLPENANLVEGIIFNDDMDICKLLRHDSAKVRHRSCLMLRLLGRFCCFQLQNQWNHHMSDCLEDLMTDIDDNVRRETMNVIEEFKCLPFFTITKNFES